MLRNQLNSKSIWELFIYLLERNYVENLPWPRFEPGLLRPQCRVLTTIRSRPLWPETIFEFSLFCSSVTYRLTTVKPSRGGTWTSWKLLRPLPPCWFLVRTSIASTVNCVTSTGKRLRLIQAAFAGAAVNHKKNPLQTNNRFFKIEIRALQCLKLFKGHAERSLLWDFTRQMWLSIREMRLVKSLTLGNQQRLSLLVCTVNSDFSWLNVAQFALLE